MRRKKTDSKVDTVAYDRQQKGGATCLHDYSGFVHVLCLSLSFLCSLLLAIYPYTYTYIYIQTAQDCIGCRVALSVWCCQSCVCIVRFAFPSCFLGLDVKEIELPDCNPVVCGMYNHPSEHTSHILYICLFNVIDAFVSAHCSCALFLAYACVSDVRDVSVPCCFGCSEELKSLHSDEVAALR